MSVRSYPRGTVAFLFTDIEGSTRLWQDHRAAMERAYARHDAILRGTISEQRGVVYKVIGDAVQAAFPTAEQAVSAALGIQLSLSLQDWTSLGLPEPLRVRMALHAGAVDPDPDGDYRSPVLNRLGRLLGAGHGGQVLLSQAAAQLARDRLPEESSLKDLGEHRLKDLLEPEHLYQLVHPALAADFPQLRTLDVARHNLPVQLTPVIGREREVGDVVGLLGREDVRLVTLTGPGGTGKTRLALQAAAELVDDYPDGVWFVPLAALTDPALVPSAVAEALGVRETGGTPLVDSLRGYLQDKRLLLVLDNFEQVLDAAPVVGGLLSAPGVTALVTSRAPLRLRGEQEYPVPPLGLPKRKPPPTAEQLSQYAAVRLFIERAQGVRPDFAVTSENAPAIAEICHRLDGLPLAIELAAARVKLLSSHAMLARLEQRLPLLTGGARDLPARQQTLRAAIAWSYDLLSEDEQKLYRRLSVFAGGWTLEAAEAVAGSPMSGELGLDVFEGLGRLVDHSLVQQTAGAAGEDRFTMLETIREFGLEQLASSGEADEADERHGTHFLELAETAEPELYGPNEAVWLDRLEAEHDNLRAAYRWALKVDPAAALRLAGASAQFFYVRGHLSESRAWLEQVVDSPDGQDPSSRARALSAIGILANLQGDPGRSTALLEEGLVLARHCGDTWAETTAVGNLAVVVATLGELARAERLMEEHLALARRMGNLGFESLALNNLGFTLFMRGEIPRARLLLEESLSLAQKAGIPSLIGTAHTNLGELAHGLGDAQAAARHFREALDGAHQGRDPFCTGLALRNIASLVGDGGHDERAVRLFGAADMVRAVIGAVYEAEEGGSQESELVRLRQRLGETAFAAAWEAGRSLTPDQAVAEALALADELATLPAVAVDV